MSLLSIKNLSFQYALGKRNALSDINLDIDFGDFVLLCGRGGSGKSTLLRLLKREIAPVGKMSGSIEFLGSDLSALSRKDSVEKIAFVGQSAFQISFGDILSELAFGLECMGLEQGAMKCRLSEVIDYFGIGAFINTPTHELSCGQAQTVSLAAAMAMRPTLLLLDEPTAQLDPVSSRALLSLLRKINTDFNTTIVISEHKSGALFELADKVAMLECGRLVCFDAPRLCVQTLDQAKIELPTAAKISRMLGCEDTPFSVKEGVAVFGRLKKEKAFQKPSPKKATKPDIALRFKNVSFSYEKNSDEIIKNASLSVKRGEIMCIFGANGSGKSTALNIMSGILRAKGRVEILDRNISAFKDSLYDTLNALPQQVRAVFSKETVRDELLFVEQERREKIIEQFLLGDVLDRHPFDLSDGESQRLGLAKLIARDAQIMLLDEPTMGLDYGFKAVLGGILSALAQQGKTIVIATHDADFAAEYATCCCICFMGGFSEPKTPKEFFGANLFYTPQAAALARALGLDAITTAELAQILKNE